MGSDSFRKCTSPAHRTSAGPGTCSLGLDSSVYRFGKKVLVQLTLISSAALTLGEFRYLVVASAQEQCLGKSKGTLTVFIESFH